MRLHAMSTARPERVRNVLFLCTGNSARSILAEALIDHWGRGRFKGHSAGSIPKGEVNPLTVALLRKVKLPVDGLRSRSWDEFARPGAPVMDFVFTVCDDAAGETCPIWPGHPVTAHWGIEDPSHVQGLPIERERAFVTALRYLENRIKLFVALPFDKLDTLALRAQVREIGHSDGASSRRGDVA